MQRRTLLTLVAPTAAAAAALGLTGCGNSSGGGGTDGGGPVDATLTLNWVPYGEHAPFYYGVAQGIYEKHGINLTIQPGSGSGTTVQQVAQQNTDFGWSDTPPLLNGISEGMPVKSIGVFLQTGPSSVEFFAEQGITEPADLVGKTVGGTPGDAMYGTFPAWLEINGVNPDEVNVVSVDAAGKISALIEGQVDAIQGFYHDQAPTIENETGNTVDVLPFADFGMNILGTGLLAHDRMISEDPDLVQGMFTATSEAFAAAAEDPEAAVAAMAEAAEQAPPQEVMLDQLNLMNEMLNIEEAGAAGVNTEAQWTETIDFLTQYAGFEGDAEVADYWDGSFGGNA